MTGFCLAIENQYAKSKLQNEQPLQPISKGFSATQNTADKWIANLWVDSMEISNFDDSLYCSKRCSFCFFISGITQVFIFQKLVGEPKPHSKKVQPWFLCVLYFSQVFGPSNAYKPLKLVHKLILNITQVLI